MPLGFGNSAFMVNVPVFSDKARSACTIRPFCGYILPSVSVMLTITSSTEPVDCAGMFITFRYSVSEMLNCT